MTHPRTRRPLSRKSETTTFLIVTYSCGYSRPSMPCITVVKGPQSVGIAQEHLRTPGVLPIWTSVCMLGGSVPNFEASSIFLDPIFALAPFLPSNPKQKAGPALRTHRLESVHAPWTPPPPPCGYSVVNRVILQDI